MRIEVGIGGWVEVDMRLLFADWRKYSAMRSGADVSAEKAVRGGVPGGGLTVSQWMFGLAICCQLSR